MAERYCSPISTRIWSNEIIKKKSFITNLKLADVTVFKNIDSALVENYSPVHVLPTVSKMFEKLMQKQLNNYINKFLLPFLCGYRKGYNTDIASMNLIEKWNIFLGQKGYTGAVLMYLSKAFETINHKLLVAKFYA